jgi:hypothetical protein
MRLAPLMERWECMQNFDRKVSEEARHLRGLNVECRIVVKWILENNSVKMWTHLSWLEMGSSTGLFWNAILNILVL